MSNYLVKNCSSETTYVVSADTLSIGEVISFDVVEVGTFCGTVLENTEADYSGVYSSSYETCCDCYTGSGFSSLLFQTCDTEPLSFSYSLSGFCDIYGGIPQEGEIYQFSDSETNTYFCAEFTGVNDAPPDENTYFPEDGPYEFCIACYSEIPRSAGTETFLCEQICTTGGTTVVSVTPPHPVWTDGYGATVTQNNMITLGGPDGLNA